MRVPVSWLAELVDLPADAGVEDLDTAFVRLGLEVEEIHRAEEVTGPLVVGRVLGIEELAGYKKPIRFCQVDVLGQPADRDSHWVTAPVRDAGFAPLLSRWRSLRCSLTARLRTLV